MTAVQPMPRPIRRPVKIEGRAAGKNDAPQDVEAVGAHHQRCADQVALDMAGALRGVDDDRIEGAEGDQEDGAEAADAEDGDGEGQPGGDRHRAHDLDRRIEDLGAEPAPADQDTGGHADGDGDEKALGDTLG